MRRTTAAVMAVFLCTAAGPPALAQQAMMPVFCLPADRASRSLSSQGEQIAAMGIMSSGAAVILWRHPETHTFTVLIVLPGIPQACVIAAGVDWERFESRNVEGDPL